MKRSLATILILVLALTPLVGCGNLVSAVQKVEVGLKIAKNLLPEAHQLLTGFQLDAATTVEFNGYLDAAGPAIDDLIARSDHYLASPNTDNYQALLNAFFAFTSDVNSKQVLLTLHIKNQQSQAEASKWFGRFSTVFTLGLSILQAYASSKQMQGMASKTAGISLPPGLFRSGFNGVQKYREYSEDGQNWTRFIFADRREARELLLAMGYIHPDEILRAQGF